MRKRSWTIEQLKVAVKKSTSSRQILKKLGLRQAGGNYFQLQKYIKEFGLDTAHFKGKGWCKGMHFEFKPKIPLEKILVENSNFQSYKLKNRLFKDGLKLAQCEECGWSKTAENGRLPLELDHINGNVHDNRLENLRILCPNCHSLKPTHRGRNKKKNA
jgi:hypothetical protein